MSAPFDLPIAALQEMPRRTLVADFHCVAGWSVRDLRWDGVPFRTIWEDSILPKANPQTEITHLVFVGLDGYKSALTIEAALADDALIADRLDGAPLTGDHGAPARLVSPRQYGYMNTKHLVRIELHTREPAGAWHRSGVRAFGLSLVAPHPRARVELEERHRQLPAWSIRFLYRRILLPVIAPSWGKRANATRNHDPRVSGCPSPKCAAEVAPRQHGEQQARALGAAQRDRVDGGRVGQRRPRMPTRCSRIRCPAWKRLPIGQNSTW